MGLRPRLRTVTHVAAVALLVILTPVAHGQPAALQGPFHQLNDPGPPYVQGDGSAFPAGAVIGPHHNCDVNFFRANIDPAGFPGVPGNTLMIDSYFNPADPHLDCIDGFAFKLPIIDLPLVDTTLSAGNINDNLFGGPGSVLWGARTSSGGQEWKYLPVRRDAIFLIDPFGSQPLIDGISPQADLDPEAQEKLNQLNAKIVDLEQRSARFTAQINGILTHPAFGQSPGPGWGWAPSQLMEQLQSAQQDENRLQNELSDLRGQRAELLGETSSVGPVVYNERRTAQQQFFGARELETSCQAAVENLEAKSDATSTRLIATIRQIGAQAAKTRQQAEDRWQQAQTDINAASTAAAQLQLTTIGECNVAIDQLGSEIRDLDVEIGDLKTTSTKLGTEIKTLETEKQEIADGTSDDKDIKDAEQNVQDTREDVKTDPKEQAEADRLRGEADDARDDAERAETLAKNHRLNNNQTKADEYQDEADAANADADAKDQQAVKLDPDGAADSAQNHTDMADEHQQEADKNHKFADLADQNAQDAADRGDTQDAEGYKESAEDFEQQADAAEQNAQAEKDKAKDIKDTATQQQADNDKKVADAEQELEDTKQAKTDALDQQLADKKEQQAAADKAEADAQAEKDKKAQQLADAERKKKELADKERREQNAAANEEAKRKEIADLLEMMKDLGMIKISRPDGSSEGLDTHDSWVLEQWKAVVEWLFFVGAYGGAGGTGAAGAGLAAAPGLIKVWLTQYNPGTRLGYIYWTEGEGREKMVKYIMDKEGIPEHEAEKKADHLLSKMINLMSAL